MFSSLYHQTEWLQLPDLWETEPSSVINSHKIYFPKPVLDTFSPTIFKKKIVLNFGIVLYYRPVATYKEFLYMAHSPMFNILHYYGTLVTINEKMLIYFTNKTPYFIQINTLNIKKKFQSKLLKRAMKT